MPSKFFLGPFALAVLEVAACADPAAAPADGDDVAVAGLTSGGVDPGDAGDRNDEGNVSSHPDGAVDAEAEAACTAISAPRAAALPRVATAGAPARALISEIGALLGAQEPPVAAGMQTFAMQDLICNRVFTPSADGIRCSLDVSIDGAAPVEIEIGTPSPDLAESLFAALVDAGASACNDFAHRAFIHLSNVVMNIAEGTLEFEDDSQYSLPDSPNVRASGAEGAAVVAAMQAASIDDCDPTRSVFIVCNKQAESPACSATFFPLELVGGSVLVNSCLPLRAVAETAQLDAPEALTLWNALVDAAAVSGYTPLHGVIEQATIINAKHFTWDGASVGFFLTADNAVVPPPRPAQ